MSLANTERMIQAAAGTAAKLYPEDVFNVVTYTGDGDPLNTGRHIDLGLNLGGNDALVIIKMRYLDPNGQQYQWSPGVMIDTVNGATKYLEFGVRTLNENYQSLYPNANYPALSSQRTPELLHQTDNTVGQSFQSNGIRVGGNALVNGAGHEYMATVFKCHPQFFDIVTWTGDGGNHVMNGGRFYPPEKTVSHNLNCDWGMIWACMTDYGGNAVESYSINPSYSDFDINTQFTNQPSGNSGSTQASDTFKTLYGLHRSDTHNYSTTWQSQPYQAYYHNTWSVWTSGGNMPSKGTSSHNSVEGNTSGIFHRMDQWTNTSFKTVANITGQTFIAYIWAHDTSDEGIIKCDKAVAGSVPIQNSQGSNHLNSNYLFNHHIGWTPQFLWGSRSGGSSGSINSVLYQYDTLRGWGASQFKDSCAVAYINARYAEDRKTVNWDTAAPDYNSYITVADGVAPSTFNGKNSVTGNGMAGDLAGNNKQDITPQHDSQANTGTWWLEKINLQHDNHIAFPNGITTSVSYMVIRRPMKKYQRVQGVSHGAVTLKSFKQYQSGDSNLPHFSTQAFSPTWRPDFVFWREGKNNVGSKARWWFSCRYTNEMKCPVNMDSTYNHGGSFPYGDFWDSSQFSTEGSFRHYSDTNINWDWNEGWGGQRYNTSTYDGHHLAYLFRRHPDAVAIAPYKGMNFNSPSGSIHPDMNSGQEIEVELNQKPEMIMYIPREMDSANRTDTSDPIGIKVWHKDLTPRIVNNANTTGGQDSLQYPLMLLNRHYKAWCPGEQVHPSPYDSNATWYPDDPYTFTGANGNNYVHPLVNWDNVGTVTNNRGVNITVPGKTINVGGRDTANGYYNDYFAICFASTPGVCQVGSYTGNGNTSLHSQVDPPVEIVTGFYPTFLLIKRTDASGDWVLPYDAGEFSSFDKKGNLNRGAETWWSSGDTAGGFINKESWGFKVSNDSFAFVNADLNVNGAHYIYLAMA